MKITVNTINLADAALMLRERLGNLRQWVAFLNDINTGKASHVRGYQLRPCLRQKYGRGFRPRYNIADVEKFIRDVLAAEPKAGPERVETVAFEIHEGRYWKVNKFDEAGRPVSALQRYDAGIFSLAVAC